MDAAATPFIQVKLVLKASAHFKGKSVFDTDVDLDLCITEDNAAEVIEEVTPQIMAFISKFSEVLAQRIHEVESRKRSNPFDSIFNHRPTEEDESMSNPFGSIFNRRPREERDPNPPNT